MNRQRSERWVTATRPNYDGDDWGDEEEEEEEEEESGLQQSPLKSIFPVAVQRDIAATERDKEEKEAVAVPVVMDKRPITPASALENGHVQDVDVPNTPQPDSPGIDPAILAAVSYSPESPPRIKALRLSHHENGAESLSPLLDAQHFSVESPEIPMASPVEPELEPLQDPLQEPRQITPRESMEHNEPLQKATPSPSQSPIDGSIPQIHLPRDVPVETPPDYCAMISIPNPQMRIRALEEGRRKLAQTDTGLQTWVEFMLKDTQSLPLSTSSSTAGMRSRSEASSRTAAASVSAARGVWAGMKKGGKAIQHVGHNKLRKVPANSSTSTGDKTGHHRSGSFLREFATMGGDARFVNALRPHQPRIEQPPLSPTVSEPSPVQPKVVPVEQAAMGPRSLSASTTDSQPASSLESPVQESREDVDTPSIKAVNGRATLAPSEYGKLEKMAAALPHIPRERLEEALHESGGDELRAIGLAVVSQLNT